MHCLSVKMMISNTSFHAVKKTKSEHRGLKDVKCTTSLNDHFPTRDAFASCWLLAGAMTVTGRGIPHLGSSWGAQPLLPRIHVRELFIPANALVHLVSGSDQQALFSLRSGTLLHHAAVIPPQSEWEGRWMKKDPKEKAWSILQTIIY